MSNSRKLTVWYSPKSRRKLNQRMRSRQDADRTQFARNGACQSVTADASGYLFVLRLPARVETMALTCNFAVRRRTIRIPPPQRAALVVKCTPGRCWRYTEASLSMAGHAGGVPQRLSNQTPISSNMLAPMILATSASDKPISSFA